MDARSTSTSSSLSAGRFDDDISIPKTSSNNNKHELPLQAAATTTKRKELVELYKDQSRKYGCQSLLAILLFVCAMGYIIIDTNSMGLTSMTDVGGSSSSSSSSIGSLIKKINTSSSETESVIIDVETIDVSHNNLTTTTVPTNSTITPTTALSSTTTLSPTDVDTDAITLCTRAQIRNGTWTETIVEGGAPYQPTSRWQRTCERRRRRDDGKFNYSLPWKTFKWEPVDATTGTCSFSEWKASDFCDLFAFAGSTTSTNNGGDDDDGGGNRTEGKGTPRPVTFAFLGDSITFQQFSSLSICCSESISRDMSSKCPTGAMTLCIYYLPSSQQCNPM